MNPIFSLRLQILCGLFVHSLCGLEPLYGSTRQKNLTGMLAYEEYFRGTRLSESYLRPFCKCSERLVQPRIVGGETTKEGEFPFAVSIEAVLWETPLAKEVVTCGGTLITNKHVLTAAHCFKNLKENAKIKLYVGEYDHKNRKKKVKRKSASYYIHPKYNNINGNDYDIAIIEMDYPVRLGYNKSTKMDIRAAYLPPRNFQIKPKSMLTVIGWGHVAPEEEEEPPKLRSVQVPLSSYEFCEHMWKKKIHKESKFCAGGIPDHDACQGDSGGGVFLPIRGIYTTVGIVSYGKSCGLPIPAVYTNLSSFVDFIYDKTRTAGCSPCLMY